MLTATQGLKDEERTPEWNNRSVESLPEESIVFEEHGAHGGWTLGVARLEGAGDKAFCAGGDLVALYRSMTQSNVHSASNGTPRSEGEQFFEDEYRLDYWIHTFPKPIVVWGHGIVMGGGWFLNRMPGRIGLFLGLTGMPRNGADALFVGLADRFIPHEQRANVQAPC